MSVAPPAAAQSYGGWASRAARWFFPYGSIRSAISGPAAGLRFRVAPGMGMMYALGRDHRRALDLLAARLRPGQTVYDVGANQGQFTLPLSRIVGGEGCVVAFEPVPENFAALAENVALNGLSNVNLRRNALGGKSGTRTFFFERQRCTMGTFVESAVKLNADAPRIEVVTECMDELVAAGVKPPDCIKIDVEGAAGEVLSGCRETLRRRRPALFVELHISERHDDERQALMAVARDFEYEIAMMDDMPISEMRVPGEYHAWCVPVSR